MSLRPKTLSSVILTALCLSCGLSSLAYAQRYYHDRTGSTDRYSQQTTDTSSNNYSSPSPYSQQRPARSGRYRVQDGQGDQSADSSGDANGMSDVSNASPAGANGRSGNSMTRSDRYSPRMAQPDGATRQRGGYASPNPSQPTGEQRNDSYQGYRATNTQRDDDNNATSAQDAHSASNAGSYNANARDGYQGQSPQGRGQSNDASTGGGMNRTTNASRSGSNQRNAPSTVSPVLQAAILPAGWQRVSGRDVPAFPETLPSLPATVRSDDGVNVTINDTVRVIASGDDIIAVIEAMGMGSLIFAAPEGSSTATGQAAPHHVRFNSQLNVIDKVADLNGTLFICGNLRLCRSWASQLRRSSSMPIVIVDDQQPAPDRVRKIAAAIGLPAQGRGMGNEIQGQFDRAQAMVRQMPTKQSVLVIAAKDGHPVVAGNNTPPDDLLRVAGGRNVCAQAGIDGYASLSSRELTSMSPDVIIISDYDLSQLGGASNLWNAMPGLKDTPAGRQNRVWVMPDLQLKAASVSSGAAALALTQAFERLGQR